jgi:TonB family protein
MHNRQHDIEKYLRGEMTPAEMHALERKALSDPFLQEALEGAQSIGPEDFSADMLELRKHMEENTSREKVISLWTWPLRIAAGLAFLAVATVLIIRQLPDKNDGNLALQKNTSSKNEAAPKPESTQPVSPADDTDLAAVETEAKIQKRDGVDNSIADKPLPPAGSSPVVVAEEIQASPPETELAEAKTERAQTIIDTLADARQTFPVASAPAAEPARAKDIYSEDRREEAAKKSSGAAGGLSGYRSANKIVKGQVTDLTDGTGLPGVNVMIKGTNVGTVTDIHGNYQLTTPASANELVFSYIGYQSQELEVASLPADVKLEQDVSQLSEVVVVGYGETSTDDSEKEMIEFAVPKGGRTAFKKYLEKNLTYPELALENNVEGKVTIQFTIGASGRLDNFTVLKGIGYGCDEEVIRLIKAGPRWTPTKRDGEYTTDKVKVRMRFRLPRKK